MAAGSYYSDKDFGAAVLAFHERRARQPIGQDLVAAKGMLEKLKVGYIPNL